jgi:hypothetical protein
VSIDAHARAHVTIDATVRIEGGWLEGFELDGLDEGLALDPLDPVTMAPVPMEGEVTADAPHDTLDPAVTLRDDGVVVLSFTRRRAPRRGDYVVHLAYDAPLAARVHTDDEGVHVPWTFPAWRHGLDSVRVVIDAPPGAEPRIERDDEIEIERTDEAGATHYALLRAHLARTREWPIELIVPESAMSPEVAVRAPEPTRASLTSAPPPARPPWQGGLALAVVSILAAIRVLRLGSLDARERIVLVPLVPARAALRALAILALGAALMGAALTARGVLPMTALAGAIVLCSVHRGGSVLAPPRLGSFRHATRSLQRAASRSVWRRRLGIDAWLDATTLPGMVAPALFALAIPLAPEAAHGAMLLALALWITIALEAGRATRPEPSSVALHRLLALARRTRVAWTTPPIALMPVVHLDVRGVAQEARLRVLGPLPEGTLRADVVVSRTGWLGARFALLVVTPRASQLDAALAADARFATVAVGAERVARMLPIDARGIDGAIAVLCERAESASAGVEAGARAAA